MHIKENVEYDIKADAFIGIDSRKSNSDTMYFNNEGIVLYLLLLFCYFSFLYSYCTFDIINYSNKLMIFTCFFNSMWFFLIFLAMVFLIKGVFKNYKQPIAFYYSQGPFPNKDMVEEVKN